MLIIYIRNNIYTLIFDILIIIHIPKQMIYFIFRSADFDENKKKVYYL